MRPPLLLLLILLLSSSSADLSDDGWNSLAPAPGSELLPPAKLYERASALWSSGKYFQASAFAVAASNSLGSGYDPLSRASSECDGDDARCEKAVMTVRLIAVHMLLLTGQRRRAVEQLKRVGNEAPNFNVFFSALNPALIFGDGVAKDDSPRFTPHEILEATAAIEGHHRHGTEWHMLRWEMHHANDFARRATVNAVDRESDGVSESRSSKNGNAGDLAEVCAPCAAERASSSRAPRLTIVIPFVPAERARLFGMMKRWGDTRSAPCNPATASAAEGAGAGAGVRDTRPELVFLFSRSRSDAPGWLRAASHVNGAALDAPELLLPRSARACFSAVRIRCVGLSAAAEAYHGGYNNSGPNALFGSLFMEEETNSDARETTSSSLGAPDTTLTPFSVGRDVFFWMETDVVPVVENWLARIVEESSWPRGFWRKGAPAGHLPMRAEEFLPLASTNHRHMNTMGLYRVGDPCFRCFVRRVMEEWGDTAWDVASHMYMQSRAHFRDWQRWGHKMLPTDTLQNWLGEVTRAKAMAHSPNVVLVHGKEFVW